MDCPACQTPMSEDSVMCIACGADLTADQSGVLPGKPRMSRLAILSLLVLPLGFIIAQLLWSIDEPAHARFIRWAVVPVALLLAVLGLVRILANRGRLYGRVMVFTAIILCAVALVLTQAIPEMSYRAHCISNQRRIAQAIQLYRSEHEGKCPLSLLDLNLPEKDFICRNSKGVYRGGYGYNFFLAGKRLSPQGDPAAIFLTADGGDSNLFIDGYEDFDTQRHTNGCIVSFADGHVAHLKEVTHIHFK